jgi:hypothetical protein
LDNRGFGLNSKRIGRSLYSLDEAGNILKQEVTVNEPDQLRKSRMTDSKFIQRSTLLGFPVSAGVTPSRVIPPMQTRPDRYLKNPPATVISTQKTDVDQLGRSISPGSYMKKTRSEIPYTEKNKIIQMQKIETKQFSLTETKPIINTLPPKQSIIQPSKPENQLQGNTEFKDGVEYTTEVTTSPGGTRRIIKRPVRKSNIFNP